MRELLKQASEFADSNLHLLQAAAAGFAITFGLVGYILGLVRGMRQGRRLRKAHDRSMIPSFVIQGYYLREKHGQFILGVDSLQEIRPFTYFNDPILEDIITKVAAKRDGIVELSDPKSQRVFMSGLRDLITGNDWNANAAALMGRDVYEDTVAMCPVSWPGLREAHLIRVVIIDPKWMEHLCHSSFTERIKVLDENYKDRPAWLQEIARYWMQGRREAVWEVVMRSAKINS